MNTIGQFLKNAVDSNLSSHLLESSIESYLKSQVEKIGRPFGFSDTEARSSAYTFYESYYPLTIKNELYSTKFSNVEVEFERYPYIAVIGGAGSGKSTLLKHLFIQAIRDSYKVPFLIELRQFNYNIKSFENIILESIDATGEVNEKLVKKLLDKGSFLLLFDGFDEVQYDLLNRVRSEIENFIDKYPNNKIVLTSRPGLHIEMIPRFTSFEIQPLNHSELESFVKSYNYRTHKEVIAGDAMKRFTELGEVVLNPLLLSLLLRYWRNNEGALPKSKSKLFKVIFQTLYRGHDSTANKNFYRKSLSRLSQSTLEHIMGALGFMFFFQQKIALDESELYNIFDKLKITLEEEFNNDDLSFDLRVTYSVLHKEGFNYSFLHKSLQEYFAALHISKLHPDKKIELYAMFREGKYDLFPNNYVAENLLVEMIEEFDQKMFLEEFLYPLIKEVESLDVLSFSHLYNIKFVEGNYEYEYPIYWWLLMRLELKEDLKDLEEIIISQYKNSDKITSLIDNVKLMNKFTTLSRKIEMGKKKIEESIVASDDLLDFI